MDLSNLHKLRKEGAEEVRPGLYRLSREELERRYGKSDTNYVSKSPQQLFPPLRSYQRASTRTYWPGMPRHWKEELQKNPMTEADRRYFNAQPLSISAAWSKGFKDSLRGTARAMYQGVHDLATKAPGYFTALPGGIGGTWTDPQALSEKELLQRHFGLIELGQQGYNLLNGLWGGKDTPTFVDLLKRFNEEYPDGAPLDFDKFDDYTKHVQAIIEAGGDNWKKYVDEAGTDSKHRLAVNYPMMLMIQQLRTGRYNWEEEILPGLYHANLLRRTYLKDGELDTKEMLKDLPKVKASLTAISRMANSKLPGNFYEVFEELEPIVPVAHAVSTAPQPVIDMISRGDYKNIPKLLENSETIAWLEGRGDLVKAIQAILPQGSGEGLSHAVAVYNAYPKLFTTIAKAKGWTPETFKTPDFYENPKNRQDISTLLQALGGDANVDALATKIPGGGLTDFREKYLPALRFVHDNYDELHYMTNFSRNPLIHFLDALFSGDPSELYRILGNLNKIVVDPGWKKYIGSSESAKGVSEYLPWLNMLGNLRSGLGGTGFNRF